MDRSEWFIAYVNQPRKVKLLPRILRNICQDSKVWVPTHIIKKKKTRKATERDEWEDVETPIFKEYIFLQFDPDKTTEIETAIKVNCSGWLLKKSGEKIPKAVTPDEIKALEDSIVDYKKDHPGDVVHDFKVGQPVELIGRTLSGMQGKITKIGKTRITVELDIFGRTTEVQMEYDQCQPVGKYDPNTAKK